jgi:hypothetical protein
MDWTRHRQRLRRGGRLLGRGGLILGAVLLALVLVALLVFSLAPARRGLLQRGLDLADERLAGDVTVARADWPRPGRLELDGLAWRDSGRTLATVDTLRLAVSLGALLRRELVVEEVLVAGSHGRRAGHPDPPDRAGGRRADARLDRQHGRRHGAALPEAGRGAAAARGRAGGPETAADRRRRRRDPDGVARPPGGHGRSARRPRRRGRPRPPAATPARPRRGLAADGHGRRRFAAPRACAADPRPGRFAARRRRPAPRRPRELAAGRAGRPAGRPSGLAPPPVARSAAERRPRRVALRAAARRPPAGPARPAFPAGRSAAAAARSPRPGPSAHARACLVGFPRRPLAPGRCAGSGPAPRGRSGTGRAADLAGTAAGRGRAAAALAGRWWRRSCRPNCGSRTWDR